MITTILTNKRIIDFTIQEQNFCTLSISDGYTITTEGLARFVGKNNEFICTEDHGHKFGLNSPFDAEKNIKELIKDKEIIKIDINQATGDIDIFLDSGIFQIICNSSGYECYQVNGPNDFSIIGHGGNQNGT